MSNEKVVNNCKTSDKMKYTFKYRIRHITPIKSRVYKHFKNKFELDNHLYCLIKGYVGSAVTDYDINNYGRTLLCVEMWNDRYSVWIPYFYVESKDGKTWESYNDSRE